jgi:hypothetical protein
MPMAEQLDRERLDRTLNLIAERLDGDWLLVGGALVALWLEPRRVTEDLDLMGLTGTQEQRLRLMELADEAGLPVEAVNTAADFFVRRIAGWEQEIDLFRAGSKARIFRPNPTLFLLLKIGRLSEQDLADCQAMIAKASAEQLPLDAARALAALGALPGADSAPVLERRAALKRRLRSLLA